MPFNISFKSSTINSSQNADKKTRKVYTFNRQKQDLHSIRAFLPIYRHVSIWKLFQCNNINKTKTVTVNFENKINFKFVSTSMLN